MTIATFYPAGNVDTWRKHALACKFRTNAITDTDVIPYSAALVAQTIGAFVARIAHQY